MEIFKLVGSIMVDSKDAQNSISKTDSKAQSLGKTFLNGVGTVAKWSAAFVTAAAGVGAAMISASADAETAFAKVETLLDSNTTDMDAYYDAIMKASNETGVSFAEMSEAVYSAISASVDAADAVDFVTQATKLAKGGFTDTTTAVDVLTTAINAYGLSADEAAHISDVLIGTQNAGKTTVDELASSMGKVIPAASSAGVSIEELSAMYAVLTKNGISTAESGTKIKAMLNEVTKAGSSSDEALRAMTKQIYGTEMGFQDMQDAGYDTSYILSLMKEYAAKNGVEFKSLFSSVEAADAAMTLMKDDGADLDAILENLETTTGTTEDAFNTMSGTLEDKVAKIKTNFQNAVIELGNTLMPAANKILDWVLTNMPMFQEKISSLMETISPVVMDVLNTIMEALPPILDVVTSVVDAVMPIVGPLLTLTAEAVKAMVAAIQVALDLIQPYIEPIVNSIQSLVEGFIALLHGDFEGFANGIVTFLDGLKSTFERIGRDMFNALWDGLKGVWGSLSNWFSNIGDQITGWFTDIGDSVAGWWEGLWGGGDGSHAAGLPTVPYDGYQATLHRGETVLNANDTNKLMAMLNGESGGNAAPINITVQSVLDGSVIGESSYQYIRRKERAYG